MATLSDIRAQVRNDIRDANSDVFTDAELNDIINQALDAVADVRPREVTETITIAASTYTYAPVEDYTRIFRIDVHNSSDVYQRMLAPGRGARTTGWDFFAGTIYLNPDASPTAGDQYHVFGYGPYSTLNADLDVCDAPTTVINGARVFVQMEAYGRLTQDRAAFQQWQSSPGNTDVSENELEQLRRGAVARWNMERQRLRRMRRSE